MSQQPTNPLLQPPFFLIPGINPSAPISVQTEQIDQLNTLLLQEIDANFAKFHQVVTAKILPEIKRFALAGEPTREAAQFWRSFYEAAAAVRGTAAGESTVADDTHDRSVYEDETVTLQREGGETFTSEHDEGSFIFGQGVTASTPVRNSKHNGPRDSWEDSIESPYEKTDRLLQDMRIGGGASLEDDSSDMPTPSLPAGYSLSAIARDSLEYTSRGKSGHNHDASESSSSRILEPPRATATSSSSTPKATRTSSAEQQRLTDLRNTPLNAKFPKPSKGQLSAYKSKYSHLPAGFDFDDSDDDIITGMSPPRTMNFGTLPPRVQAIQAVARDKTPKKGVVADTQSVLDDLLSEMHNHESSPRLESPVMFGDHHSLLPEEMVPESQLGPSASGSGSLGRNVSGGGLQLPAQSQGNRRSMAANTSYGSDIVTGAPHGQIIGDDSYGNDDSFSSDGSGTVPPPADYRSDISYMTNTPGLGLANRGDFTTTMHGGEGRDGRGELRDTEVFGQPGGVSGDHRSGGSGSGRPFELMKMDEMYTFHGGRLEDAAGREVDDTPVKARSKRDP